MKHNTWLNQILRIILPLMINVVGSLSFAKIINSEFLNQADVGSEGPQIAEIEMGGSRAYLLSYNTNSPGKEPKFRSLSEKEYRNLQSQMRAFLKTATSEASSNPPCDREITYTKVERERQVSHKSLCWAKLGAKKRTELSNWMIQVRKSLQ